MLGVEKRLWSSALRSSHPHRRENQIKLNLPGKCNCLSLGFVFLTVDTIPPFLNVLGLVPTASFCPEMLARNKLEGGMEPKVPQDAYLINKRRKLWPLVSQAAGLIPLFSPGWPQQAIYLIFSSLPPRLS